MKTSRRLRSVSVHRAISHGLKDLWKSLHSTYQTSEYSQNRAVQDRALTYITQVLRCSKKRHVGRRRSNLCILRHRMLRRPPGLLLDNKGTINMTSSAKLPEIFPLAAYDVQQLPSDDLRFSKLKQSSQPNPNLQHGLGCSSCMMARKKSVASKVQLYTITSAK